MIKIRSETAANGPDGLCWDRPGAVVAVKDERLAAEILAKPGFSEVTAVVEPKAEASEPKASHGKPSGR